MGELIYMVSLDKLEYISTTDKMRELELCPDVFHLLLGMLQYRWKGDRIDLLTIMEIEYMESKLKGKKFSNVTQEAVRLYTEFSK